MSYINKSASGWARRLLFCAILGLLGGSAWAGQSPYATTIIINGKVITADSDNPKDVTMAQAVAIQNNKILAVGSNEAIKKLSADWTEVIDAKGNTVTPGLIDTHSHLYDTSLGFPWVVQSMPELLEIHLHGNNVDELTSLTKKAIAARRNQVKKGEWIRVGLAPAEVAVKTFGKTITRAVLDALAPDNPVLVSTRGGSVQNTKSIEAFESYYDVKLDPAYWKVDRKLGWSPEYTDFTRCSSIDLIAGTRKNMDKYIRGYFQVMQVNAQIGVTTYKTHIQCEKGWDASVHLGRNHLMPIRLAWANRWMQPFNPRIEETYRRIGDWTGDGSKFLFSIGSSVGGIDAGGVGWCTDIPAKSKAIKAREECPPAPEGVDLPFITKRTKEGNLGIATNRGRRVEHFVTLVKDAADDRLTGIPGWHTSGEGTLELMQKTYQHYMSDKRLRQLRIESDHCHTVTPAQIQVAARLNWTFSCDISSTPTKVLKQGYGEEYLSRTTPVGMMLKAGVRTVISEFSSQGHVRHSAFEDGKAWITGVTSDGVTWGVPESRVPDKMTLLLMMTRWGAYPLWKNRELGSIEVGKTADIVILNGDYMATPASKLDTLVPLMTMVGGQVDYEAPGLRGNTLRFNPDSADWTVVKKTPTDIWRWKDGAPCIPSFLSGAAEGDCSTGPIDRETAQAGQ